MFLCNKLLTKSFLKDIIFSEGEIMTEKFLKIIEQFPCEGNFKSIVPIDTGLINTTYKLSFSDGNRDFVYILQQINTNVFKNPDELMSNIMNVTGFLRNKIALDGGNPQRETLTFLYTKENSPYYRDDDGKYWRICNFILNTYGCDKVDSPLKAERSGAAFGRFQNLLSDYPIETLFETIPDFHNTPVRYEAFKKAMADDIKGRLALVKEEIEFALNREKDASKLTDMIKSGDLPVKVTHNDTKINNVRFDSITNEAICVIDLDTIMPGLSLYDFGDAIRACAVTTDENEKDLNKYSLDTALYKGFAKGFISQAGKSLTQNEVDNLAFSAKLMALECGVRFLTDYLNGDTYFKIDYPEHNLVRCHTQFKLVKEIEEHLDELNNITEDIYRRSLVED